MKTVFTASEDMTLEQLPQHLFAGYDSAAAMFGAHSVLYSPSNRLPTLVKYMLLVNASHEPLPRGKKLSFIWGTLQNMEVSKLELLDETLGYAATPDEYSLVISRFEKVIFGQQVHEGLTHEEIVHSTVPVGMVPAALLIRHIRVGESERKIRPGFQKRGS